MLLARYSELLWVLRREGFAVSVPQAIEGLRAMTLVGFSDAGRLTQALSLTLGASVEAQAAVARLTHQIFIGRGRPATLWDALGARGATAEELEHLRSALASLRASHEGGVLGRWLGEASELNALLAAGMPSGQPAHPEMIYETLGFSGAASLLEQLRAAMNDALGQAASKRLVELLALALDDERRHLRKLADATQAEATLDAGSGWALTTPDEERRIERGLSILCEKLQGAREVKARHARRGRIDIRKTLRAARSTQGIPLRLVYRVPREKQRKWVVCCDLSESVRQTSAFLLQFVAQARRMLIDARFFVFVGEAVEITELMSGKDDSWLEHVQSGAVLPLTANSNYERALGGVCDALGGWLDRRTTLVVLGDGRSNFVGRPEVPLETLRKRAARVLWICPEAPERWGKGDSLMPVLSQHATRLLVARDGAELEQAVRGMVAG